MSREELIDVIGWLWNEKEVLEQEKQNLKKAIFGAKSERFVPEVSPAQTALDFGQPVEEKQPEPVTETITYEREKNTSNKNKPSRQPIPVHLERVVHTIQPEEDVTGLVKIGEEVTEELEYVPGKLFVNKFVRPKYVKQEGEQTKVLTGKLPERPLPKCIAGTQLLAALIVAKFIDHLPLYRQSQMFKRLGVTLPDSTIGGWVNGVAGLLKPLYEAHKKQLLSATYLQADETPIQVLENESGGTHQGYHWAYYDPVKKLVLFDYRPGRGKEGPNQILKNFKGHLQTDGYAVYDAFGKQSGITLMHCWAHVRRKFAEAEESDRARAHYVLLEIQKLYALEREMKEQDLSVEAVAALRTEKALPIIEALKKWLLAAKPGVLPKSPIGKAIDYTLPRIAALTVYTTDGRLQIDNNPTENAIRPIALGRKNYLFAGSHEAAQNAAMFYSLFATCKVKGINPYQWLAETLKKIASHPINRIEELLPGA